MDSASDHSIKTREGGGSQVMTSVSPVQLPALQEQAHHNPEVVPYRLYKRRYVGLVGLVRRNLAFADPCFAAENEVPQVFLNFVGGMSCPWFGPIASNSECPTFSGVGAG